MENQPGTVDELTALYRETIVKHAVSPTGFQVEIDATHSNEVFNPLCGDRIEMLLRIAGDDIEAISFRGEACAICMASASLLCEHHSGTRISDFESAHGWLQSAMSGGETSSGNEALKPLLGVKAFPSRVKCALLPWEAVDHAIRD